MKLKFKLGKPQLIGLGVAAAVLFGLMANGASREPGETGGEPPAGTLDSAARQACDDLDTRYWEAKSKPERLALADKVMTSTRRTENDAIRDRAAELGLRASDGGAAWRSAADAVTGACRDAGWSAP